MATASQPVGLKDAHPCHVAVSAIDEKFVPQHAFRLKAEFFVHMAGAGVFDIDDEVNLVQIQRAEAVFHCQRGGAGGDTASLMVRGDDNLKFGAAVDVVDFDQLDQPRLVGIGLDDEAALALVVDVFVVKVGQLGEGLVRLLKPVAHDVSVVIELVDKGEVFALKRAQADGGVRIHGAGKVVAGGAIIAIGAPARRCIPVHAVAVAGRYNSRRISVEIADE